jgi:Family of unknown function (DUF6506)
MAEFNVLFLYLAPGADPTRRFVRDDTLSHVTLVPVPSADAAASVARELLASEGVDLIELYGGLGPTAAAKVLAATGDGEVPVGVVGVEYSPAPEGNIAAMFAADGADSATDRWVFEHDRGRVTVVVVPSTTAAPSAAEKLVAEGAERIEVCGGMGPVPATEVMTAVGDRVPVSAVLFGFESLPAVAAYRARFAAAASRVSG